MRLTPSQCGQTMCSVSAIAAPWGARSPISTAGTRERGVRSNCRAGEIRMRNGIFQRLARLWREYRGMVLFLLLMLGFRSAWADWVTVPTGSMNPTILEGDRLLVDKHVFGLRIPFTRVHLTAGESPAR